MVEPISHPNVWPVHDDLLLSWRGGSSRLSVFVSDDPIDAGVDVRPPDGPGRVLIPRCPRRQYFHLFEPGAGFTVVAQRQVELDGAENFRDLGGYLAHQATPTRWGQVFRSDRLDQLTDRDRERLTELGIDVVFDLRSAAEVEVAPDRLPAGVESVHLPMSSDVAQQRSILQRIVDDDLPKLDHADMADGYLRMLEGFGDHISRVIESVAAGRRVLFHCTAGKDRTGVVAMILLGLAGVDEPQLLDDYEVSSRYRSGADTAWFSKQIVAAGYDPIDYSAMWGSDRKVMKLTLEGFRRRWGDHLGYLRFIGIDATTADAAGVAMRYSSP